MTSWRDPLRLLRTETMLVCSLAAVAGLIAGIGAVLFEYLAEWVTHVALVGWAGYRPDSPGGERALFHNGSDVGIRAGMLVLIPALGGLVSAAICRWLAPEAGGHGTDAAIDVFHNREGRVRGRVPLVKALATAITLGTGGSGGREGPIAQIGAGFGSMVADLFGRGSRVRRLLLISGMGAGIGAVFRAPLAGALFATEILYRDADLEADAILPSFIASSVAYCFFCAWFGDFGHVFVLHDLPVFGDPRDLLLYGLIALAILPFVWSFQKIFYGVEHRVEALPVPRPLVASFGAGLAGVTALSAWAATGDRRVLAVLSHGYGLLQDTMDGEVLGWSGVFLLGAVAFGKILATSFTIGAGGSAGIFGPSIVVGGTVGGAVGLAARQFGIPAHPAACVIMGMTGFLAGAARTPISAIIMVSEITGNYALLLPSMWVSAVSFVLCSRLTLYSKQVRSRAFSPVHRGDVALPLLEGLRVEDVMESDRAATVTRLSTPLREVWQLARNSRADYLPVLDDQEFLVGVISARVLRDQNLEADLGAIAVAADVMSADPVTVTPRTALATALEQFGRSSLDELPVVGGREGREFVGMLRRRAVTRAYRERLDQLAAGVDGRG